MFDAIRSNPILILNKVNISLGACLCTPHESLCSAHTTEFCLSRKSDFNFSKNISDSVLMFIRTKKAGKNIVIA